MTRQRISVIPGDGIGPSVIESSIAILEQAGCKLSYDFVNAGLVAYEQAGELLPEATCQSIKENGVCLKGPLSTPIGAGFSSVNLALRQHFDLFANIRPVRSFEGTPSRYQGVDIITVRENTEGIISGHGQKISDDGETAEALSIITRQGAERIVNFAYDLAHREQRRKVSIIHKADIMRSTSGLFLETARKVARKYPDIESEEMIIDAACMNLVIAPERFDVLVTTNLFGDILSDLCAGLVGGLGIAPGANFGEKAAIFEAVHGSAPDIAGKNIANPSSVILASVQMLEYLQMNEAAMRILKALKAVIASGEHCTRDLGGTASTTEFTQAIIRRL